MVGMAIAAVTTCALIYELSKGSVVGLGYARGTCCGRWHWCVMAKRVEMTKADAGAGLRSCTA